MFGKQTEGTAETGTAEARRHEDLRQAGFGAVTQTIPASHRDRPFPALRGSWREMARKLAVTAKDKIGKEAL
jgi:hypothetical protein